MFTSGSLGLGVGVPGRNGVGVGRGVETGVGVTPRIPALGVGEGEGEGEGVAPGTFSHLTRKTIWVFGHPCPPLRLTKLLLVSLYPAGHSYPRA